MADHEPLDIGSRLPAMPLRLSEGDLANTTDHLGRWLVLYFYPRDSTPGCTAEGRDFDALLPKFQALNASLLGVSRDSVRSHRNFRAKQGFRFELVSDPEEALCRAFGVIKPKKLYGRDYTGIERSTFLIGPDGRIVQAWRAVKVSGHAQAVLDALQAAQQQ